MQQYQGGQSQFNQPYPQQQFQQQQPNQFNQGYQQQQPYGYNNNFNYRQGRQANSQATTQPAANGAGSEQLVNPDHPVTSTLMPNLTMPSPPELPGFCSQNATAQYVFDSCMVQVRKFDRRLVMIKLEHAQIFLVYFQDSVPKNMFILVLS